MTGYAVSNAALCEAMRKKGIPSTNELARIGRSWRFYHKKWRDYVSFFLNHTDRVPLNLWEQMSEKDRERFPEHQRPLGGLNNQV